MFTSFNLVKISLLLWNMTSKFACFGPSFFPGFLTRFLRWVYPQKNPVGFFGYVPRCPNPAPVEHRQVWDPVVCYRLALSSAAAATFSCQLLSSVTSAFISTLTSPWGDKSPRPSLPASPYCISYEAFADPSPDPFSSRWYQLSSLVFSGLDYGNATLAGIPLYRLKRLQSVMNYAARLVLPSSRYDHITPLLHELHWLKAAERID